MTLEIACMFIVAWMFLLGTWTTPFPRDYKILVCIVEVIIPRIMGASIVWHLISIYILKNQK